MSDPEVKSEDLINQIMEIEPKEFEELVANLWEYLGYDTEVTQSSSDRGIDVTAIREFPYEEKILIQAKRYSSTISGPKLREYGVLTKRDSVDSVIVISTSGFTSQARQEAEEYNVKLIDGPSLAQLLIQEDAVDLVREFTGEIEAVNITPKRPSTQSVSDNQEIKTVVGEGEFLTIQIAGYGHMEYETKECTVVCLYFHNKSNTEWSFIPDKELAIISKEGFSHSGTLDATSLSYGPWSSGDNEIKRNSKSRVVLFYPSKFVPHRIEFSARTVLKMNLNVDEYSYDDKEEITIFVNDDVTDELNTLPDSLPTDSVSFFDF